MPVSHVLEQWSGHCQRYSPYTKRNYHNALTAFVAYSNVKCLKDITPAAINTWLNSLLGTRAKSSLNTYLIAVKSFGHWLADTYNIPNPADKVRFFTVPDKQARCLTPEEYDTLLATLTGRPYHVIRFLCTTGLRVSEFERLTSASLNGPWLTVVGKRGKIRHVPLNDHAAESLRVAMKFSRNRFVIQQLCYAAARKAGVAPFGPHACRHFFVTRLLARGADIHHVSKAIGHSSVLITEKYYYHFVREHLTGLTDGLE